MNKEHPSSRNLHLSFHNEVAQVLVEFEKFLTRFGKIHIPAQGSAAVSGEIHTGFEGDFFPIVELTYLVRDSVVEVRLAIYCNIDERRNTYFSQEGQRLVDNNFAGSPNLKLGWRHYF